jgi:hypothetical protein
VCRTLGRVLWLAKLTSPSAPREVAADGSIDSYVRWLAACEHVRRAYRRWRTSAPLERRLAFEAYLIALEREEHAAVIHAYWTEQLDAPAG